MAKFQGATYSEPLDKERLSTALERVERALATRHWYSLAELAKIARCSEAGASARIRDLRRLAGYSIVKRRRGDPKRGLWEYFLEGKIVSAQQELRL